MESSSKHNFKKTKSFPKETLCFNSKQIFLSAESGKTLDLGHAETYFPASHHPISTA